MVKKLWAEKEKKNDEKWREMCVFERLKAGELSEVMGG